MIAANPLNGVGARGFRSAFPAYAAEGDPFINANPPINPFHSHQLWLEILSESGIVGALLGPKSGHVSNRLRSLGAW